MDQTALLLEFQDLIESLPPPSRDKFLQLYVARAKNPLVGVGLAAFLGSFGVNRFYLGQHLLGVVKLACFVGLLIIQVARLSNQNAPVFSADMLMDYLPFLSWLVADTFMMDSLVAAKNLKIAQDIKSSMTPATIWQRG